MISDGGALDHAARTILPWLDIRHIAAFSLIVVPLLAGVRYWRTRQKTDHMELLSGVLSVVTVFSGVTAGIVLMFTRPLAVDALSGDTALFAGCATLLTSMTIGWRTVKGFLAGRISTVVELSDQIVMTDEVEVSLGVDTPKQSGEATDDSRGTPGA